MHRKLLTQSDGIAHLANRCGSGLSLRTRVEMIDWAQARVSPAIQADVAQLTGEHSVIS